LAIPTLNLSDGFEVALSGFDDRRRKMQKSSTIAERNKRTVPKFRKSKQL